MNISKIPDRIARLICKMEHHLKDKLELYLELRQQLNALTATGMPLPDDLVRLQGELEVELSIKPHPRSSKARAHTRSSRKT